MLDLRLKGGACILWALSMSPGARQYLEGIDQGQVVESDVIVVVLDVSEGLLVTLHQCTDLAVLPLLHLVDLSLPPQVKLVSKHLHLLIVPGLNLCKAAAHSSLDERVAPAMRKTEPYVQCWVV